MCLAAAILACCSGLHFAVECLVDNTAACMLTSTLWPFAVAVSLMQFFCQKLEKLMGILLLGRYEILKSFLLRNPKAREDTGRCIPVGAFQSIEILKHVIHSAA